MDSITFHKRNKFEIQSFFCADKDDDVIHLSLSYVMIDEHTYTDSKQLLTRFKHNLLTELDIKAV